MSKFIPLLNNKVQDYLEKFDLNIVISFNELMQVDIFNPKQPNTNIEYESFSKGEKKRLDMAILLSFIRVTKEICNWHCNIMFLDELLDGGLDSEGLNKVGTAIKSMVEEDNLCVYTISHRKLSYDLFNNYLFVEKDKYGFSSITHKQD
jgi:ABC-type multidrug transport system ATPase subunit